MPAESAGLTSRYSCIMPAEKGREASEERESGSPRMHAPKVVDFSLECALVRSMSNETSRLSILSLSLPPSAERATVLVSVPPNSSINKTMAPGARLVHRNSCSVVELAPGAKATSLTSADVRAPPKNDAFESFVAVATSTAFFRCA